MTPLVCPFCDNDRDIECDRHKRFCPVCAREWVVPPPVEVLKSSSLKSEV